MCLSLILSFSFCILVTKFKLFFLCYIFSPPKSAKHTSGYPSRYIRKGRSDEF